jgi:hypothetical protein
MFSSITLYQYEQKVPKLAITPSCTQGTYYKEHNHILTDIHMKLRMLHGDMQCIYVTKDQENKIHKLQKK